MKTLALAATLLAAAVLAPAAMSNQRSHAAQATLVVRSSKYGRILFDGRGRALYAFTRDSHGRSACYGACAKAWPVYFAKSSLRAGSGVKQSLLGSTRRRDGRLQVTYAGRPLYYYVGDGRAGVVKCQGASVYGGTWLVVRASGKLVR
ncbi:MAG: hypothetical protein WBB74_07220 [Gaiellaceae bacterium]